MGELLKAINGADNVIRATKLNLIPAIVAEDHLTESGFYDIEYAGMEIAAAKYDGVRYSFIHVMKCYVGSTL